MLSWGTVFLIPAFPFECAPAFYRAGIPLEEYRNESIVRFGCLYVAGDVKSIKRIDGFLELWCHL